MQTKCFTTEGVSRKGEHLKEEIDRNKLPAGLELGSLQLASQLPYLLSRCSPLD